MSTPTVDEMMTFAEYAAEDELLDGPHCLVEVIVEDVEDIGGVNVITGQTTQARCGCTFSLEHMYGHEKEES